MNLTCPDCNTTYNDAKKFCGKCGTPLVAQLPPPDDQIFRPTPTNNPAPQYTPAVASPSKNLVPVFICIAVVLMATIGYFGYTKFAAQKNADTAKQSSSDLSHYIQSVSASSSTRDVPANIVYSPDKLYDNLDATCWAANLRYDPTPAIVFTFIKPMVITSISAIPGYKKFKGIDRYIQNCKPRHVVLTYNNQDRKDDIIFDLAENYASLGWQTMTLDRPVTAKSVTVKIIDSYPGQYQGNKAPSNDLSISEFHFIGYPE